MHFTAVKGVCMTVYHGHCHLSRRQGTPGVWVQVYKAGHSAVSVHVSRCAMEMHCKNGRFARTFGQFSY